MSNMRQPVMSRFAFDAGAVRGLGGGVEGVGVIELPVQGIMAASPASTFFFHASSTVGTCLMCQPGVWHRLLVLSVFTTQQSTSHFDDPEEQRCHLSSRIASVMLVSIISTR